MLEVRVLDVSEKCHNLRGHLPYAAELTSTLTGGRNFHRRALCLICEKLSNSLATNQVLSIFSIVIIFWCDRLISEHVFISKALLDFKYILLHLRYI